VTFINVVYDVKIHMLMSHNGMASVKISINLENWPHNRRIITDSTEHQILSTSNKIAFQIWAYKCELLIKN